MKAWEDLTIEEFRELFKQMEEVLRDFGFVNSASDLQEFASRLKNWDVGRRKLPTRCPSGYPLWSHNRTKCGCECGVL